MNVLANRQPAKAYKNGFKVENFQNPELMIMQYALDILTISS